MHNYGWFALLHGRNQHNSVKFLFQYLNKKYKKRKKKNDISSWLEHCRSLFFTCRQNHCFFTIANQYKMPFNLGKIQVRGFKKAIMRLYLVSDQDWERECALGNRVSGRY